MTPTPAEHDAALPPFITSRMAPSGAWKDATAGCCAGALGALAGQPLDTVRVRMQGPMGSQFRGPLDAIARTVRWDGVAGLFKGLAPQLVGMSSFNLIFFATFGSALRSMEERRLGTGTGGSRGAAAAVPSGLVEMRAAAAYSSIYAAGTAAALVQSAVIIPSDRLKCQLQMQTRGAGAAAAASGGGGGGGGGARLGVADVAWRLVAAQGVAGIWRGTGITLGRQLLGGGVYLCLFEALRREMVERELPVGKFGSSLLAGGISGSACWALIYPVDTLKSYVQVHIRIRAPAAYIRITAPAIDISTCTCSRCRRERRRSSTG